MKEISETGRDADNVFFMFKHQTGLEARHWVRMLEEKIHMEVTRGFWSQMQSRCTRTGLLLKCVKWKLYPSQQFVRSFNLQQGHSSAYLHRALLAASLGCLHVVSLWRMGIVHQFTPRARFESLILLCSGCSNGNHLASTEQSLSSC